MKMKCQSGTRQVRSELESGRIADVCVLLLMWASCVVWSPLPASAAVLQEEQEGEPTASETEADVDVEVAEPVAQVVARVRLDNGVEVFTMPIEGVTYTSMIFELRTGDNHDPSDAPGLSQMLVDLAATAGRADGEELMRNAKRLDRLYPAGWAAQSYPDHAVIGWVVKPEASLETLRVELDRMMNLDITRDAIAASAERMREDIRQRFHEQQNLIPMSWITAKAFRHVSHPYYGTKPDALARLSPNRVKREWDSRVHPQLVKLHLVGDLSALAGDPTAALGSIVSNMNWPATSEVPSFRETVEPEPQGDRRRRIVVDHLPSEDDHVVVAYYAPDVTAEDHPAFLAAALDFQRDARKLPGAGSRLEFQYSMLLDPRAAYFTPHIWRYSGGAKHALSYWALKIKNRKFSSSDGRKAHAQIAWQLGDELPGTFITRINRQPAVLYTVAYAEAFRSRYGNDDFWTGYRERLERLSRDEVAEARSRYLTNENAATFVLTTDPG